jgi:RsiW-degrading membrane proteinase PrsW (M82 family)
MLEILYICVIVGALWFLYIYQKDIFEPEPLNKILKAVGWGAIPAVIIALCINTIFHQIQPEIFVAVLIAPLVEEACKGFHIYKMRRSPELEGPMDGLVYGAAVAIGFEIVENILYSISTEFGIELSAIRSIVAGHILFTGLFGLMVGLAKIKANKSLILYGYAGAVLLHVTWNGLLAVQGLFYFILVLVFIFILKKLSDVAWKYELDAYISPREDMETKARRFVMEHGGASTTELAAELGIAPHRTALFMKSMRAKFDRERKKWLLVAPE